MYNYNPVCGEATIATGHAMQFFNYLQFISIALPVAMASYCH
jgi:hypothetical protein